MKSRDGRTSKRDLTQINKELNALEWDPPLEVIFKTKEQDLCVGCGASKDEPHDEECPFDEFEGF